MAKKRGNLDRRLFSSSPRVGDFLRQKKPISRAKTRFCGNSHIYIKIGVENIMQCYERYIKKCYLLVEI